MQPFDINWLALAVATIVNMVLGAIWYSPVAFVKQWMQLAGVTQEQMKANMVKGIVTDLVGTFIMAWVLIHPIHYAGANTPALGAAVGFFNWLGFIGVVSASAMVYEHRPFKLFLINNGYRLLSLLIMGAILAGWQ